MLEGQFIDIAIVQHIADAGDLHRHRPGSPVVYGFPLVLLETKAHLPGPVEPFNAVILLRRACVLVSVVHPAVFGR